MFLKILQIHWSNNISCFLCGGGGMGPVGQPAQGEIAMLQTVVSAAFFKLIKKFGEKLLPHYSKRSLNRPDAGKG